MIARRLTIRGRVQGVGFRYALVDAARALGAEGWVHNRRDGAVEAQVQGDPGAVERVIAWCEQGPPAAEVASVEVDAVPADAAPGFELRPTI